MNHRVTYFYFAHVTVSGWEPIGKGIKAERGLIGFFRLFGLLSLFSLLSPFGLLGLNPLSSPHDSIHDRLWQGQCRL